MYLVCGLCRYRLRGRALAGCPCCAFGRVRASYCRGPAFWLAASRIRRQGRAGAKTSRVCFAGGYATELVVRGGSAPARQIDRVLALPQSKRFLDGLVEIGFHALARYSAAQEIRPQEFAERCCVFRKTADASQFAGEAAERIVLEVLHRFRKVPEVPAFTLGVVGVDPPVIVEHAPERVTIDHGEVSDDGHENVLDAFIVKRARQMVVVDHVVALVRSQNHWDHMFAQKLRLLFLRRVVPPALALFLNLSHSDGHLRRMQREYWNRMEDQFARIRHDLKPIT